MMGKVRKTISEDNFFPSARGRKSAFEHRSINLSLTPGFSRVEGSAPMKKPFQRFLPRTPATSGQEKPLKRLCLEHAAFSPG